MIQISKIQLLAVMPNARSVADTYLPYLNKYMAECHINTPLRVCHFLAQIAHESGELKYTSENLNYSASGLLSTFPKYFNSTTAAKYARKPQAIASHVYANRLGNGDEASGDGWKYRGRGLIQYTGKDNYKEYATWCGYDVVKNPDLLSQPLGAVRSACHFFDAHGCNLLADRDNGKDNTVCINITKKINGGRNGLVERIKYLVRAKKVIK